MTNFPINSKGPFLGPYSPFLGQKDFFQKIQLSHRTPHARLTPCSVPQKTYEPKLRKLPDGRTERWKDGQTNSLDTSGHFWPGVQKIIQMLLVLVNDPQKSWKLSKKPMSPWLLLSRPEKPAWTNLTTFPIFSFCFKFASRNVVFLYSDDNLAQRNGALLYSTFSYYELRVLWYFLKVASVTKLFFDIK